jgi:hypothetical protein
MDEGSHNPKNEDILRLINNIVVCKTTVIVVVFALVPCVTTKELNILPSNTKLPTT